MPVPLRPCKADFSGCLKGQAETVGDQAELLVRAVAADLLRHHLAQDSNHGQTAVLQLLQLLLGEHLGIIRLEAQEGGDLARNLGVVLLVDGQLVDADQRNNLRPARAWHRADGRNATGDVVEMQVLRRREELVRRRDQVVGADCHAKEGNHADAAVLDLDHTPPVESSLIGSQAQRIPHLALRRAAENRVVDAANQILDRHAHRSARGRASAQGRALEGSRRAEQRKHLERQRRIIY
mmetsp:Transcript_11459/g.23316  ORF Transcript_11459/g.23316 Transcript_11459/m.23316 type:complete len:238 (-) Transcript_11459:30-743(-)